MSLLLDDFFTMMLSLAREFKTESIYPFLSHLYIDNLVSRHLPIGKLHASQKHLLVLGSRNGLFPNPAKASFNSLRVSACVSWQRLNCSSSKLQSNLSTTAPLKTEESGRCRNMAINGGLTVLINISSNAHQGDIIIVIITCSMT